MTPAPALRTSLAVTMASKFVSGALNFVAAPLYARLVGLEGFGLIGVYVALQGLLQILEIGLTTAAGRELAMRSVRAEAAQTTRDFVRSVEAVYWAAALLLCAAGPVIAWALGRHWLTFERTSGATVTVAILCMVGTIAAQWPLSLYMGALMGLHRQVTANAIFTAGAVGRVALTLAVLGLVSPSVIAFFVAQAAATVVTIGVLALALWRSLPPGSRRPRFSPGLLKGALGLAAGISGVSLFSTCLNQADKVVLSRHLPLAEFGTYMLACTLAATLYMAVTPICASVFPRLSQLVALGDRAAVNDLYAKSAQLVGAVVGPAALVMLLFASDIVLVWTRDAAVARPAGVIAAALAPAVLLSAFLEVSLGVQRAYGLTRFSLAATAVGTLLIVPAVIAGVRTFGPVGGAGAFAAVKSLLAVVQIAYTGRALGDRRAKVWTLRETGLPLTACLAVVIACRWLFAEHLESAARSAWAVTASLAAAYGTVVLLTPATAGVAGEFARALGRRYTARLRESQ